MPEKNTSHEQLSSENELEALRERVEELEGRLKKEQSEIPPERREETIKEEIKEYLEKIQSMPETAAPLETRDEAKEISKFPASQQIGALVSLALEKGMKTAISAAQDIDNPAILDEFHDILIDRYYDELVKKGIIKP